MKNYIQDGDVLDLLAPYDVVSGAGFQVGDIFAVAMEDALSGAEVRGQTEGVIELLKETADDFAVGELAYWDNSAKKVTVVATANKLIGAATEVAAATTATVVRVKLSGQVRGGVAANQAAVATADGSDAATTQALANALKVAHNALLVKIKAAGLMVAD